MKSTFIFSLAGAGAFVAALPSLQNQSGLSDLEPVPVNLEARQAVSTWSHPSYCTEATQAGYFQSIYTALEDQPATASFDYSSFCSAVVQSYTYLTIQSTNSGYKTDTATSTTTTFISTTTTDSSPGTTTLLCATPSPSMSCNITANGYYNNFITDEFIQAADCNQLCLNTPACKSFQVVPQDNGVVRFDRCNLYNVSVAGNVDTSSPGIVAKFYDRDCGDLLPPACSHASPALITPAPSLSSAVAIRKRVYTLPSFLSSYGEELLLLPPVCSCIISAGPPVSTLTVTNVIQSWVYVTVTTLQTEFYDFTAHPEWKTVYESVS